MRRTFKILSILSNIEIGIKTYFRAFYRDASSKNSSLTSVGGSTIKLFSPNSNITNNGKVDLGTPTNTMSYVAMNNSTSYERAPYSDTLPAPSKFKYGGYSVTEGNFIADIGSADCR